MTNEEAKELYQQAVDAYRGDRFEDCLDILGSLDAARPNSRNVTWLRGLCLAGLGQVAEADQAAQWLADKMDGAKLDELRGAIATAKAKAISQAESHTMVAVEVGEGGSAFRIESANPIDTDRATVVGYVEQGVIRVGEALLVRGPGGVQALAPVTRIGPADTPLNLVRAGQKALLLLACEPQLLTPGAVLTASPENNEGGAATMVVEDDHGAMATMLPGAEAPEAIEAERLLRQGRFDEAHDKLQSLLLREPEHPVAHRVMARVHLDSDAHRNAVKALEHARMAYNHGGARDGAVTAALAEALAANGEAAQGLRYIERLHTATSDAAARSALAQRVSAFRERHALGHLYEFADAYGDVVFQSSDLEEIRRALGREIITSESKCRRDRIGEWSTAAALLGSALPEWQGGAGASGAGKRGSSKTLLVVAALVAAVAAFLVVVLGAR